MTPRWVLKKTAKESLAGKWGIAIGTFLVESVILTALMAIKGIGIIATIVLAGVLSVGMVIVYLEIIRNWECRFEDMFKGFNNFGTNSIAGVLVAVYVMLWSLLFIIPGIVKAYSYAMTFYILADNPELTASQAIAESKRMMEGNKGRLFVLHLSFFWWVLLVSITGGIAGLYVYPYMRATDAAFYEDLKANATVVVE